MTGTICIIGSGFSAASLALHLVTKGLPGDLVTIVGPGRLGAGQAYGCVADDFRLNVRDDLQRIWPDDPSHFADWAATRLTGDPDAATEVGTFYRRRDFADYVTEEMAACSGMASVTHQRSFVKSLKSQGGGWHVDIDGATGVTAQTVVLATGNPAPDWPFPDPPPDRPNLVRSPWRGDWPSVISGTEDILIIGGGLTALDALHTLHRLDHGGRVILVAPEGMLPPVQTGWQDAPSLEWPENLRGSGFLKFMRRTVGDSDWSQVEWQRRFEGLRVQISSAWRKLPASDQARLLRRVGWLWSLARFRAGPQPVASAQAMLASGQLTIIADKVTGLGTGSEGRYSANLHSGHVVKADAVINCSGAGRDKLVSHLIGSGVVAAHPAMPNRPAVTDRLALLKQDRTPHDDLFALGPLTAHAYGDVIGAATISRQAQLLTNVIMRGRPAQTTAQAPAQNGDTE